MEHLHDGDPTSIGPYPVIAAPESGGMGSETCALHRRPSARQLRVR